MQLYLFIISVNCNQCINNILLLLLFKVGLMRNGLLIEEGSLQEILTKYSTVTLEAAFLTSCCNQKIIEVLRLDILYY